MIQTYREHMKLMYNDANLQGTNVTNVQNKNLHRTNVANVQRYKLTGNICGQFTKIQTYREQMWTMYKDTNLFRTGVIKVQGYRTIVVNI